MHTKMEVQLLYFAVLSQSLTMGKDESKEIMGKVYREFSRQRYNKYKHQFPKMRESEIVSKIIREWDSLDLAAKHRLNKVYKQNKTIPAEDLSESETGKKSEEARMTEQGSAKKDEINAHLELTPQEEKLTAEKGGKDSEQVEERKEETVAKGKVHSKSKSIGKVSSTDYFTFFRHFYEKYSSEHPKWKASQISKIIRLLWRKNKLNRLANSRFRKGKLERSIKSKKPISGKSAFKKHKNLSTKDTTLLWKHLPIESRRYWENEAQGKPREVAKQHKLVLRANMEGEGNNFGFLSKVIG